ncbi:hypothetical protein PR048_010006 [Dryococelus australis]|uniref:Uncharacterized protein n=1 Tax=Dryococelus australis TaxID=614101 RepID=A0ABQ9I1X9_9NEOP|nr:hypothetical protein PR048_010006 [Dryococelus australis]
MHADCYTLWCVQEPGGTPATVSASATTTTTTVAAVAGPSGLQVAGPMVHVKSAYFSDNSQSLPGIMGTQGPVGFEPGMFRKEGEGVAAVPRHHKSDPGAKIRQQGSGLPTTKVSILHQHDLTSSLLFWQYL